MSAYTPSKLFKFIANSRLQALFAKFGIEVEIDWETRKPSETKSLSDQWATQEMDKSNEKSIGMLHDLFQDICDIAAAKADSSRIAMELADAANPPIKLDKDFGEWNRFDQAAYVFLNMPLLFWNSLMDLVVAEDMSLTRKWTEYNELPKKEPDVTATGIKRLEDVVTEYFREEKKCETTHIEFYTRYDELYFFFATLDDTPQFIEMKSPGENEFEPTPAVMPYRIIFAYNYTDGEFSLFAPIPSKEYEKLAAVLIKALVGHDGEIKRLAKATYNLSPLSKRGFQFVSEPSDGLSNIHVKSLTVAPIDAPTVEITFKDKNGDVYDSMDAYLDRSKIAEGDAEPHRAIITMKVDNPKFSFRSLTFELTEKTCTLKSLPESKRKLGEKLLKSWGLKNA